MKYVKFKENIPEKLGKAWNLAVCHTSNWQTADIKILVVLDHVPSSDIRNGKLLSSHEFRIFDNVFSHALQIAKWWDANTEESSFGFFFISWANFKTYDLKDIRPANKYFVKRLHKIIKKLQPHRIHFMGELPAYEMYDIPIEQRAWVKDINDIKVSSNISITSRVMLTRNKKNDYTHSMTINDANLLGHAAENLARLLLGHYPFSLSRIKPKYKIIDTIPKWKKLYKKLWKAKRFAYDLETYNLSVHRNGIITAQFTLEDSQDLSHILLLKTVESTWSVDKLKEIYGDLRKLFSRKFDHEDWNTPYIIGQNLMFDLMVTRVELGIPIIHYRAWDTMAGCYILDENQKSLQVRSIVDKENKNKPFALDAILAREENDFYYTHSFGKKERQNISNMKLTKEVLEYAAMDSISTFALHVVQKRKASKIPHGKGNFKDAFCKLVLGVWSDTIHTMSHMKQSGLNADRKYIVDQHGSNTSSIERERNNLINDLYDSKSTKKANSKLIKNVPVTSLFDGTEFDEVWEFDITKNDHKQLLFFDTLKLKPLGYTATGKPKLDAEFKKWYSDEKSKYYSKEVALWKAIEESVKVRGYIKNYYQKIHDLDGMYDDRIHASYGFLMVVTGRSNSHDPNLQNVPEHGQYAKMVKRAFVAKQNRIKVKGDFGTHEIVCWGQIAMDDEMANVFSKIRNMARKFRSNPTKKNADRLKLMDPHRMNYALFTGIPIEKVTDEQRQKAKNITFGAMYGQAVSTMASALNIEQDEMQAIYDAFFNQFKKAKKWLNWATRHATKSFYVFNPFGFRRHLYGYMSEIKSVHGAMDRRAMNAPIQGFASQLAFIFARLFMLTALQKLENAGGVEEPEWDKKMARFKMPDLPFNLCAMVHDSSEIECEYNILKPMLKMMEYCATEKLVEYTAKMYGIKWIISPRMDFEIGDTGDNMKKWNFTEDNLKDILATTIKSHKERSGIDLTVKEALKVPRKYRKMMND